MEKTITTNQQTQKPLAESVPPYARRSAKTAFLTLWDCANFLLRGNKSEKDFALKRLENIKEGYNDTKSQILCTLNLYGRDMLNYYAGKFDKHELGKFYKRIKESYDANDKKGLKEINGELEKIVKGFHEVYSPSIFG